MTVRPVEDVLRIEDLTVSSNENTDQPEKEDALVKELEGVRNLNRVMEGVITAMTKAKDNLDAVGTTVENADRLLDIWIKVLSQSEHTQRLLLDGKWQGSTEDARAQEEILRLESEAAEAASRAAELARQKAIEAAEKAKLEAANRIATKTPTGARGRGILKNTTVPVGSTRGRGGISSQQTFSVRGRGSVTRGTRGTTTSASTRGASVRGRGSLVRG